MNHTKRFHCRSLTHFPASYSQRVCACVCEHDVIMLMQPESGEPSLRCTEKNRNHDCFSLETLAAPPEWWHQCRTEAALSPNAVNSTTSEPILRPCHANSQSTIQDSVNVAKTAAPCVVITRIWTFELNDGAHVNRIFGEKR